MVTVVGCSRYHDNRVRVKSTHPSYLFLDTIEVNGQKHEVIRGTSEIMHSPECWCWCRDGMFQ